MVVISKQLFYEKLESGVKCKDLIHPDINSCTEAIFKLCTGPFLKGVFYFYLPIHLLQLILEYKKVNRKNILKKLLENVLRSECFGMTYGGLLVGTICAQSHLLGVFKYYKLVLLPGIVSGLSIILEHPRNRYLNTVLWASLVIEALFKNAYYFKLINYSPVKETVIFMLVSSLLMHLFVTKDNKQIPFNLWFYRPSDPLKYRFTVYKYFTEIVKYFGLGYGVNYVRCMLKDAKLIFKNPLKFIYKTTLSKKNFKFGIILGAYVCLFRGTSVLLEKYCSKKKTNTAIAGFLAGLAYYIEPNMTILATAFVTVLQILCHPIATMSKFNQVPFTELAFTLFNGILFFNRIASPDSCPNYYRNMLKLTGNQEFEKIYARLISKYLV